MSDRYTPDQILGHSDEADGIEEYDNRLPRWWVGLFLFCIAWSPAYAIHYHIVAERSQAGDYDAEMAAAAEKWPQISAEDAANMEITADVLAEGEAIYTTNCVACHAADMTGGIGPNLVDDEWIHGSTKAEITSTITNGVTEKGMPPWGPVLGPEKVAKVAAFVHSKNGT
ncbi:MAG: c-type cytochrome [Alphaproteobacteria bacterium]|nr:c-type cytochrome [Alphaproteobacteria bacterium]